MVGGMFGSKTKYFINIQEVVISVYNLRLILVHLVQGWNYFGYLPVSNDKLIISLKG